MNQDCLRGQSRRSFVTSVVGLCGGSVLLAQDSVRSQDNSPTFSSSVKVVNLFATVRDKDGKIVSNLTKDDFELTEDGRPQAIKYFAPQTDLPLTLGLLVDTSGSERRNIPTEKDATYKFIEKVMRPDRDKAFLIHFDREVELLQDLTSSRAKLERALELLQSSQPQQQAGNGDPNDPNDPNSNGGQNGGGYPRGGGGGGGGTWGGGGIGFPGGGGMGYPGGGGGRRGGGGGGQRRQSFRGGTAFYDAIYLASDDVLKTQKGRKAIIMLTDGEDNGSKETISSAIDSAQRSDVLGYAIHIADSQANSGFSMGGRGGYPRGGQQDRPDGKKILKQISKATGGGYFEFKKSLDDIYEQIDEELRNQYSIGYTPDRKDSDGDFHKIELTVKKKGLVVQSRDGYYS